MADRTVTLSLDEIQALIDEVERLRHVEDFEAECPTCTAHRTLKAALTNGVNVGQGGGDGKR